MEIIVDCCFLDIDVVRRFLCVLEMDGFVRRRFCGDEVIDVFYFGVMQCVRKPS